MGVRVRSSVAAAGLMLMGAGVASPALATEDPVYVAARAPKVAAADFTRPSAEGALTGTGGAAARQGTGSGLAVTGGDILGLTGIALGLVGGGSLLWRSGRTKPSGPS